MSDVIGAAANAPSRLRVAVLASGRGSHFASLVEGSRQGDLPIDVVGVFCDRTDARVLQRARDAGIDARCFAPRAYPDRLAQEAALFDAVESSGAQLIVCAGYMRVLGADVVRARSHRMINIHPSLLPRHRGLHTHRRALQEGDVRHGASVHFVTAELDGGPVIAQASLAVAADDDEGSLAARVLALEHPLLRACVALIAAGRLGLRDERVWLDGVARDAPLQLRGSDGSLPHDA